MIRPDFPTLPERHADGSHGLWSRVFNGGGLRTAMGARQVLLHDVTFFDPRSKTNLKGDPQSGMPDQTFSKGFSASLYIDKEMFTSTALECVKVRIEPLSFTHYNMPAVGHGGYEYAMETHRSPQGAQVYCVAADLIPDEVAQIEKRAGHIDFNNSTNTSAIAVFLSLTPTDKRQSEHMADLNQALELMGHERFDVNETAARRLIRRSKLGARGLVFPVS